MENGIYNIPAKGGIGLLAMQIVDGKGRMLGYYSGKGWSHRMSGEMQFTDMSAEQLEALKGYGLADDQTFVEIV